ncbi:MAG: DUF2490 domain-containing protein [Bacteroidota bacterium]
MLRTLFLLFFLFAAAVNGSAQTVHQNSGWLFLMNATKINEKWSLHFDAQLRSANDWDHLRNLLIRPGITYSFNKNNDLTVGYLFTQTYTPGAETITENRAWEQYIHKHKISTVNVSHRLRLEQRFVEKIAADNAFSQRFRYFVRCLIPLKKDAGTFESGFFTALQNEVFLNVQNKGKVNGSFFDQNRAYAAGGYRFSKKIDVELGYMNQAIKGAVTNTNNNVIQAAVYTRF